MQPPCRLLPTLLLAVPLCLSAPRGRAEPAEDKKGEASWVEAMKKVHARFKGTPGTFAHFGDSITISMAHWAPLRGEPKKMSKDMARAHKLVKGYMKEDCWAKWKGPKFGNEGSMTIRWADDNVSKWLKDHNPETVLIMFGTN